MVSPERIRNKNVSREATTAAKQTVFMSKRGRKPSDRRVEICDFQAKQLVSTERYISPYSIFKYVQCYDTIKHAVENKRL